MNFKIKCAIQNVLSFVPGSEKIGSFLSRYFTKNLGPNNDRILLKINEGYNHYLNFKNYNQLNSNSMNYYEFGAGWTLTIPILISRLGFNVTCIDIKKLIKPDLVLDSIGKYASNKESIPKLLRPLPETLIQGSDIVTELESKLNIKYKAPHDARNTRFDSECFDFIASTLVINFIPTEDVIKIIKESYRILKVGGVMSVTIDYQDNWSYIDTTITGYNFLKFSEKEWKRYNPSVHFQNRLRHNDYLEIFEDAGFKIVKNKYRSPDANDIEVLKNLKIDNSFSKYSIEELGIKDSEIVVIKL
jgi:SAM-dependent methyltransferase